MSLRLASGEVVVDRLCSHLHPGVAPLLPKVLARIDSKGGRLLLVEEVDFGRPIGESSCVPTGPEDEIVYARRRGRFGISRFVKNRQPEPCSAVTVVLKRDFVSGVYVILTAYIGYTAPPEPWDDDATEESAEFWSSRALVWGVEPVDPGTETTISPPWKVAVK